MDIHDVLNAAADGAAVIAIERALADVVRAVDATENKGAVTITITIVPPKPGGSAKGVAVTIAVTMPRAEIEPALLYSDDRGQLHRDDPQQATFGFETGASRKPRATRRSPPLEAVTTEGDT
jgi:hypothetical protein